MTLRVLFMTWMCAAAASVIVADEPPRAELPPAANPAQPQVQLQVRLVERVRAAGQESLSGTTGRVLNPAELKELLRDLPMNGSAKILAEPTLRLEIGKEGRFRSGREIPFDVPSSSPGEPPTEEKMFFGTSLDATVTVPKPGLLSLLVHFEQSEQVDTGKKGPPGINKRAVNTRIELQNGQTMMLDRLVRHQSITTVMRNPLLGDIPVIGNSLFAKRRQEIQTIEMIVLITAELVEEPVK